MKRNRRPVSLWIVSLATVGLLVGCGGNSGTKPEPVVPAALRESLADFCRNASNPVTPFGGVPGAGHVIAEGRNHLVALDASGSESPWAAAMPADWRPATLADTELVACVQDNFPVLLETCTYLPAGKVTRVRFSTFAEVFEAATGRKVTQPHLAFDGSDPPPCPETNPSDTTLEGERIQWATVQPRLESLVAGEALGGLTLTLTGGPFAGTYSQLDVHCAFGKTNPGVWQVEALDETTKKGLGYFYFLGYDGPGFTDLSSIDPDAKLMIEILIGPYSVTKVDTYKVLVAKTADATVGKGEFSVEAKDGGAAKFRFTGEDASGVGIAWTAFCPSYWTN